MTITRFVPWKPQPQRLGQIVQILKLATLPLSTINRSLILMQLQHLIDVYRDLDNYLVFILARAESILVETRRAAAVLLENRLMTVYAFIDPEHQRYIRLELLHGLGEADQHIRSSCETSISIVLKQGGILGWPELFYTLLHFLDSDDPNRKEGAMYALSKISDDTPELLNTVDAWSGERPINKYLVKFLECFQSPHAYLRKFSLRSINKYIISMPCGLHTSMNIYLDGLVLLSNDQDAEVRKLVCTALLQLVEFHPSVLEPHLKDVIKCMLQLNKDNNDAVALKACGFWSKYFDAQMPSENLREYLPHLTLILWSNMAYADDDVLLAAGEVIDAEVMYMTGSFPDRYQDLKPELPCSDEKDGTCTTCNLRKCSASVLDVLSNVFGAKILLTFIPTIEANLSATGDEAWKDKEASVLALGVIARGCINGLYPRLSKIVASLIPLLDHKFTLIRSTSCWTLSQFSKYIVQDSGNKEGYEQFDMVLMALLQRTSDTKKLVQGAACSALATLEEEAAEKLAPRLKEILQHLMRAFSDYQRQNLRLICDAIGTLADAVGEELNQSVYVEILIPPLFEKWQSFSNLDKDLLTLLECFTSIVQALGRINFSQFTQPVFNRCMAIIKTQLFAKDHPFTSGIKYDKEFITCSLDLLSGLTECFDSGIETLVLESDLRDMLLKCCTDDTFDVRQSAFGLLGDIARVCPIHLHPDVPKFLDIAVEQLRAPKTEKTISVANNACWAIGELAVQVPREISPLVRTVISCLIPNLNQSEGVKKSLVENSAITLGRLAFVCPDIVSPHVEECMELWCISLSTTRDDIEKEDAFKGLCAMVKANPSVAQSSLLYVCKAIASWKKIWSTELNTQVCKVMHDYQQMLTNEAWNKFMSDLDPLVKASLAKYLV